MASANLHQMSRALIYLLYNYRKWLHDYFYRGNSKWYVSRFGKRSKSDWLRLYGLRERVLNRLHPYECNMTNYGNKTTRRRRKRRNFKYRLEHLQRFHKQTMFIKIPYNLEQYFKQRSLISCTSGVRGKRKCHGSIRNSFKYHTKYSPCLNQTYTWTYCNRLNGVISSNKMSCDRVLNTIHDDTSVIRTNINSITTKPPTTLTHALHRNDISFTSSSTTTSTTAVCTPDTSSRSTDHSFRFLIDQLFL